MARRSATRARPSSDPSKKVASPERDSRIAQSSRGSWLPATTSGGAPAEMADAPTDAAAGPAADAAAGAAAGAASQASISARGKSSLPVTRRHGIAPSAAMS